MGVNDGTKLFLRVKGTDKILSNAGFKSKIELSYKLVVKSKVGPNWVPGSSLKDL